MVVAIGGDERITDSMRGLFPATVEVLTGTAAKEVIDGFQTNVSPIAYQIEAGKVTGRSRLTDSEMLFRFVAARDLWDEHELNVMG